MHQRHLDRELEELEDKTRKLKLAREEFSEAKEYGWPFSLGRKPSVGGEGFWVVCSWRLLLLVNAGVWFVSARTQSFQCVSGDFRDVEILKVSVTMVYPPPRWLIHQGISPTGSSQT